MSKHVMPFLVVNYGCEMMFVLAVRLEAQLIEPTKATRIKSEIVANMFSAAFTDELFRPQGIYTNAALRKVFTTVSDSSIMKLSENSMKKLYDLMSMTVKCQVLGLHHPYELLEYTCNHLDELKRVTPSDVHPLIDGVATRVHQLTVALTVGEMADIRGRILNFLLDRRVKVSMFLENHTQFADGNFKLPPAQYLSPVAMAQAPGHVYFYAAGKQVDETHFPHRDAAMSHPPNITVGRWGPAHFSPSAPRMTTNGANVYRSTRSNDALSADVRGVSSGSQGSATAISPLLPLQASAEQLQAYQNEMNFLSQLAGNRVQTKEKIKLSLFEDNDVYNDEVDTASHAVPMTTAGAVGNAPAAQTLTFSSAMAPAAAVHLHQSSATSQAQNPSEPSVSPAVKVCKMDAGAVKQQNTQLLGIIDGLEDQTQRGSSKTGTGGDTDLLDIMDSI